MALVPVNLSEVQVEYSYSVGMDLGKKIGKYSKKKVKDAQLKKQKMEAGRRLLEMLAKQSQSHLADTAKRPIKGFAPLAIRA